MPLLSDDFITIYKKNPLIFDSLEFIFQGNTFEIFSFTINLAILFLFLFFHRLDKYALGRMNVYSLLNIYGIGLQTFLCYIFYYKHYSEIFRNDDPLKTTLYSLDSILLQINISLSSYLNKDLNPFSKNPYAGYQNLFDLMK